MLSFKPILNYRRDIPSRRTQKDFASHPIAASSYDPTSDLRPYEYKPVLNQSDGGSCTGHGTAQGLFTSFAAAGQPLPFMPSPKSIYAIARTYEADAPDAALSDSGAMPADAMAAINMFGIRAMRGPSPQGFNSDVDSRNINEKEDLMELEEAGHKIVVGQHRILENSTSFAQQIAAALSKKVVVMIGGFVDSGVMNYVAGQAPLDRVNLQDANGGGHWWNIVGHRIANGHFIFICENSWGVEYGDAGHFEVTDNFVRQSASDLYPVSPVLAEAA